MDKYYRMAIINFLHYNKNYTVDEANNFFNSNVKHFEFLLDLFGFELVAEILNNIKGAVE